MVNKGVGSENRLAEVAEVVEDHSDEDDVEVVRKKVKFHCNNFLSLLQPKHSVSVDCYNLSETLAFHDITAKSCFVIIHK